MRALLSLGSVLRAEMVGWSRGLGFGRRSCLVLGVLVCCLTGGAAQADAQVLTSGPLPIGAQNVGSVACVSATQCTAVDVRGNEVTFDPTTGTADGSGAVSVDPARNWTRLRVRRRRSALPSTITGMS
jgi:hypothetical protein